jgi:hypothetical protein
MKVSGFTFVRNGISYDYPFRESILSILPLVDEMIVNVPSSEDQTYQAVASIKDTKIRIITSEWDTSAYSGGRILSYHTNLALKHCTGDWCFYIQADEVVHEDDYPGIKKALMDNYGNKEVEGLLFNYRHFYGSYNCVATAKTWYRKEIRVIRNNIGVFSFEDAQGFRKHDNKKLKVRSANNAFIYHYGWVRPPESMKIKTIAMDRLWHGNKKDEENKKFKYKTRQYGLRGYTGTHPKIMSGRIAKKNWDFEYQSRVTNRREFRYWLSDIFEKITGICLFEYKGYEEI